ncbi:thiamine pyrophosphate-binding protein [Chelativorans sp.]|uniref:thiamine pyrophosphate-binding protein n=1 Tax=Chelativorans sp. TaxID=2203393 RepID=UPI0028112357|nr:thiamine pyrophosphate-binding protein [Chelativorans sp.]
MLDMNSRAAEQRPALARTGGQILVDQLVVHGVSDSFCVPGESYLAVLDALHDAPIRLTVCRQEGGAAMMAEAQGKLTGRPGICFVTRGPGATNASAGVHVAMQDSTPMILFIGQVERGFLGREAFQEIDYSAFFGPIAKWATQIDDPARIPEVVSRAFHVATSGRPGPVVIGLPEDVLSKQAAIADARAYHVAEAAPSAEDIGRLLELLDSAERPLVIAGGARWDQDAVDRLVSFSDRFQLPVAVSFRRQGLFPSTHRNFVGDLSVGANPKLVAYARRSDLILLVGGRLSELPSQNYTLLGVPDPGRILVHVHPGAEELGRVYRPDLGLPVSPIGFMKAVSGLEPNRALSRAHVVAEGRELFEAWTNRAKPVPGEFNLGEAVCQLRDVLPEDAIVCNGAGNYATWVHRYHRYRRFDGQLAPTSGSMGYGVPAAIAAKRLHPDRVVVAFAGDGCFMMHGQEFATAVQHNLPIIVVIADNGMYGTIRMHQEREFPGRVTGTSLTNPNFAAYARIFGGYGERVERTQDFLPAFERALESGLPSIIHCIVHPEALTPERSLSQIRDEALARAQDTTQAAPQ